MTTPQHVSLKTLPCDVLVEICAILNVPSMLALLATCHDMLRGDAFYFTVAVRQWSFAFWHEALTRTTARVFHSMRDELCQIHRMQQLQKKLSMPEWNEAHFRTFWEYERLNASRGISKLSPPLAHAPWSQKI